MWSLVTMYYVIVRLHLFLLILITMVPWNIVVASYLLTHKFVFTVHVASIVRIITVVILLHM